MNYNSNSPIATDGQPIAKMLAVHKNGRFYGQSVQKSTAVHEKGGFCGWEVKMSVLRLNWSIRWCNHGAKRKKKNASVWKLSTYILFGTRSRSPVIVVYWGLNWPNCVKMRHFVTNWCWIPVTNWVVGGYGGFVKNARSYSMKRWPKVTNAKSLRDNEGYCVPSLLH